MLLNPENLKIQAVIKNVAKEERDIETGFLDGDWDVKKIDNRNKEVEMSNGRISITKNIDEVLITSIQPGQQPTREELWQKAHKCIMGMGDIFYDPKDAGDLDWGLDDETGEAIYAGDDATERLLNSARQNVYELLLEEYGLSRD